MSRVRLKMPSSVKMEYLQTNSDIFQDQMLFFAQIYDFEAGSGYIKPGSG